MNPPASARPGEPDVTDGDAPGVAGPPRRGEETGHDNPVTEVDQPDRVVAAESDDGQGRAYVPL